MPSNFCFLVRAPALVQTIPARGMMSDEAPPKLIFLKPRSTRLPGSVDLYLRVHNLLHSRTTTATTIPPPTSLPSYNRKRQDRTPSGVAQCMLNFSELGTSDLIHPSARRQQSVSGVSVVPDDMFQLTGQRFTPFGASSTKHSTRRFNLRITLRPGMVWQQQTAFGRLYPMVHGWRNNPPNRSWRCRR